MKKTLRCYLQSLFLLGMLLVAGRDAYANHILGMDLSYTHVSGNTYKITLTAFGDCGNGSFNSLTTAAPRICVYNGTSSITTLTLALEAPAAGAEITPVCVSSIGQTTCTSPTMTIPGVKKFVYSVNYTVPSTSATWRFIFNGAMGGSSAGRASTITNITNPGSSIIQLIATLDNTTAGNSSPTLTVGPTPYFCLNNDDNYTPGAVDGDGDSLRFTLVAGRLGNTMNNCTISTANTTYSTGYSATNPLHYNAGTYSFDPAAGQIEFNPDIAQNSLVIYSIAEYRGGVLVGTSQREMSFLVQTCTNTPANGPISNASAGVIDDSTHYHICQNTGAFTFHVMPTETNPTANIKITASSLPAGSTFNVVNDSTPNPDGLFTWTSNSVTPGTYTFFLYFKDDNCPVAGTNSVAYNVTISPTPVLSGPTTVCGGAAVTLSTSVTGGTWSSTSPSQATVNASTGVVTGINTGTTPVTVPVNYVSPAGCTATPINLLVNPQPAITPASPAVCVGSTLQLSNNLGVGTWSSGTVPVATIGTNTGLATGVTAGSSVITFRLTSTGCTRTVTLNVNATPAVSGPALVCAGATIQLSSNGTGGTWSSSNSFASVSGTGVVTGNSAGTSVITYTAGAGCFATQTVTVRALPNAIIPGTPVSVCVGSTSALSDNTAGGGTWSSSNVGMATVNATGTVGGVAIGTPNITFTSTATGCFVTKAVTVNTTPAAITPASPVVCTGQTRALSDGVTGGAWSIANPAFATVDAVTGVVSGVAVGTTVVSYSIGTCSVTQPLTVNLSANAGTISGAVNTCVGGTPIQLSDNAAGGVWSSGNVTVATVTAGGVVTGVSAGSVAISYSVTNSCGTAVATYGITVSATSGAGSIVGPTSVCAGTFTTLTATVPGGVWSASNTNVTITGAGLVTGFTAGAVTITYSVINACGSYTATKNMTVGPFLSAGTIVGANTVCTGNSIALTDLTAGGAWSSTNSSVATITGLGVVSGVTAGTTTISYLVTSGCGSVAATHTVTVNLSPNAGTIIGTGSICAGTFTTLSNAVAGGVWSSTNPTVATISGSGVVTGMSGGTTTISYTLTNTCGTAVTTLLLNVNPAPNAGTVSGAATVCIGTPATYTASVSGGVWSMSNTNATISAGGVVLGSTVGTSTVIYTVTNSCGSATATRAISVNPALSAGVIGGPSVVCASSLIMLSASVSGGVWSASNGNATINSGGIVTGIFPGTDTISYTIFGACGATSATRVITIAPSSGAGTITGATSLCPGSTIVLSDALVGGVWSSGNTTVATVDPATGVVAGITVGSVTITYTLVSSCGANYSTYAVTVAAGPVIAAISGPSSVCISSSIALSDATPGGIWSASGSGGAITAGGVVMGVSLGSITVTYTVTNLCGTGFVTKPISIVTFPTVTIIAGPSGVCEGAAITLSNGSSGGTWSSTSPANATVDASAGVVTGVTAGTTIITYLYNNGCGTVGTSKTITVNPTANPGVISGADSVCVGATIMLTDAAPGGVWSAGNANATVTGAGMVTGIVSGTTPISYSVTTVCGTVSAVKVVTILSAPAAGTILGPSGVCVGTAVTLTNVVPGGTWLSSNGNATFTAPGILQGVTPGLDTIFYLVNNGCGAAVTNKIMTVNPMPVVSPITGATTVCPGATNSLASLTAGGVWSSDAPGVATINPVTGDVTGASAGTANITYTVTNAFGCPGSQMMAVTVPGAAPVTGSATLCELGTTTLSDVTPGGAWSTGNAAVATIDVFGNVTGVSAGSATISYTVLTVCGLSAATFTVTVNGAPVVSAITGVAGICTGAITMLANGTTGGIWSSDNTAVATVSAIGMVTGVAAGTANISYTVTDAGTGCSASAVHAMAVDALPVVGAIGGVSGLCTAASSTLFNATPGGVWSSSNNAIATVDPATGLVTGVSGGVVNITYTVTSGAGCSDLAATSLIINTAPVSSPVTGANVVCEQATIILSDAVSGGAWSTSGASIAVTGSGVATGMNAGTDYAIYTRTNACGAVSDSMLVTVLAAPSVSAISAMYTSICVGSSIALSTATTGGTWSTSDASVATVDASGIVTTLNVGTVTIAYATMNSNGCIGSASIILSVGPAMPSAAILPLSSATLCDGNPVMMTVVSTSGGLTYQWYQDNGLIAGANSSSYTTSTTGDFFAVINNGVCSITVPGPSVAAPPAATISFNPPDMLFTGAFHSYQWYLNGVAIPGATSGILHMVGPGDYTVVVTDENGCSDSSLAFATVDVNMLGSGSNIGIYPNPATSVLHIDAAQRVDVSVMSMDGKVLMSQKNAVDINISGLANGLYMIIVYDANGNQVHTARFTKTE